MATRIERTAHLEYIGLGIALAGLVQWVFYALFSLAALFFGPLIMCWATLFLFPYGLASVILGWLSRKRNAFVAWVTIAIGLFLPAGALALAVVLGELVGRATR